jgi:pimeloyl-ACP methyl ester carboxylesterase
MEREEIRFDSHGDQCAAWVYPSRSGGTSPAIVMAHGLTGTRRDRLGAFAERFARAGITAFVFDHRGFGDSGGKTDLFEPRRQLEDWTARSTMPAASMASIRRGWLVCVGEADQVATPGIAIRAARRAPLGEVRTYPGVGHFDIYDGPEHEAVVADEIEFLGRHLQVSPCSSMG